MDEIPAFLRRTPAPTGAQQVTTPAPTPAKTRTPRKDAYIATIKVKIPLDMTNAATLTNAVEAVQSIKGTLPAGTIFEVTASLGKI